METNPQQTFVPGKDVASFRNYDNSSRQEVVENHYRMMRKHQTVEFQEKMHKKWLRFDKAKLTIREAFQLLDGYVDSSDPDSDMPNLEHNFQTAEAIRAAGKPDWFQLVGLIHDMGKLMYAWGSADDGQQGTATGPQWALGGDTWVVGCRIPDSVVFPEFNDSNQDMHHPEYSTVNGVYKPGCGLNNLTYAFGHDEYMYQVLVHNKCTIPKEGLAMVRLHSCYPLHSKPEYRQFFCEGDEKLLESVKEFNEFDLYTKADKRPCPDELWPYYQSIIDRYCPGKLSW